MIAYYQFSNPYEYGEINPIDKIIDDIGNTNLRVFYLVHETDAFDGVIGNIFTKLCMSQIVVIKRVSYIVYHLILALSPS